MSKSPKALPYRQRRRMTDQAIHQEIDRALQKALNASIEHAANLNGHGYSYTTVRVFFEGIVQWIKDREHPRKAA